MNSRLAATSSSLFANNTQKFLMSVGPQTTKAKGVWHVDHADEAVRGMLVCEQGTVTWPPPPPKPPAQPAGGAVAKEEPTAAAPVDYRAVYMKSALQVLKMQHCGCCRVLPHRGHAPAPNLGFLRWVSLVGTSHPRSLIRALSGRRRISFGRCDNAHGPL
jgi:hypothetical protein